jgi:hypothetical protein
MSNENLDPVLKKHLGRLEAPANLWNHVRGPVAVRGAQSAPQSAWTWAGAVAMLAVAVGGWIVWSQLRAPQTVEAMAMAALDRKTEDFALRTEDAASVRKWVKSNSGIDIPLPPKHSGVIRIVGARIGNETNPVAEVAYRVGEFKAALLITKASTGATVYPKHSSGGSDAFQTARVTSWSMKGQSYTLAWTAPGEFRTACLLCHDQEPPLVPARLMN